MEIYIILASIMVGLNVTVAVFGISVLLARTIFESRKRYYVEFSSANEFILCCLMDILENNRFSLWTNDTHVPDRSKRYVRLPSAPDS